MQNLSTVLNDRSERYTSEPFTWTSLFVIQGLLSQSHLVQSGEWDRGAWRGSSLVAAYVGVWRCVPFMSLSKVFSSWILPSLFFFPHSICIEFTHSKQCQEPLWQKRKNLSRQRTLLKFRVCNRETVLQSAAFLTSPSACRMTAVVFGQGTARHSRFAEPWFLTACLYQSLL